MSKLQGINPILTKCNADENIEVARSVMRNVCGVLQMVRAAAKHGEVEDSYLDSTVCMLLEELGYADDCAKLALKEIQKIDPPHEMTDEEVEAYLNRETRAAS